MLRLELRYVYLYLYLYLYIFYFYFFVETALGLEKIRYMFFFFFKFFFFFRRQLIYFYFLFFYLKHASNWHKPKTWLRMNKDGYHPKQAKVFLERELYAFLHMDVDGENLDREKLAVIFGML